MLYPQQLAWKLGVPLPALRSLAATAHQRYKVWSTVDAVTGKKRTFMVPDPTLKAVQRKILARVLSAVSLPESLHGGIRGRSPGTNAKRHLGKDLVVKLDVRDFFPSVDHRRIAEIFWRTFGCGREVTWLLTRLTTFRGELPQGAPTSTMLANLLLAAPVAVPTEQAARGLGADFTAFVDDMALSGPRADELINGVVKAFSRVGLRSKRGKLKIMPHHKRQEITGLVVNSARGPSVALEKRQRIRLQIHHLSSAVDFDKELRSINGKLSYIERFNPGSAARLRRQLDRVLAARAVQTRKPPKGGFSEHSRPSAPD